MRVLYQHNVDYRTVKPQPNTHFGYEHAARVLLSLSQNPRIGFDQRLGLLLLALGQGETS